MKLKIVGLKEEFDVLNFNVDANRITVESEQLTSYIDQIGAEEEPPAPPPAPKKVVYESTEKMGAYTREQYEAMNWTVEQMVEAGYLVAVAELETTHVEEEAPPAPPKPKTAPAPPAPESNPTHMVNRTLYEMAPKAAGATREQFIADGWTDADLITEGYLVRHNPPREEAPTPEWPKKNENEEWVDSAGTLFDKVKHGMTKDKIPSTMKGGIFKTKRGYVETTEASETAEESTAPAPPKPKLPPKPSTAASKIPAAPGVPKAPSAPAAPGVTDEALDAELEGMIKDWV